MKTYFEKFQQISNNFQTNPTWQNTLFQSNSAPLASSFQQPNLCSRINVISIFFKINYQSELFL